MRISEVFNMDEKKKKKRFLFRFWFFITGLLSLVIILVTVYGQNTGTFLIGMTNEAADKGIMVSDDKEFTNPQERLKVNQVDGVEDMLFEWIKLDEAEATDGQYIDPEHPNYIAYTFYLKNVGKEVVDLEYNLQIVSDYNDVRNAAIIRVREFKDNNGIFTELIRDVEYRRDSESNRLKETVFVNNTGDSFNKVINFRPGEIRKISFFLWLDGRYTTPDMKGGAFKMSFSIAITSGEIQ